MSKLEVIGNNTTKSFLDDSLSFLELLINKGGPDLSDYDKITKICDQLLKNKMSIEEEALLYEKIKPLLSLDSMFGFSFLKPHGYAGDHELIDRIYQKWHSTNLKNYYKWDKYYHSLDAPQAVRNRKEYLKEQLIKLPVENNNQVRVLNLASGPCTDLYEFLHRYPRSKILFDCLDLDSAALEYGAAVCDAYADKIEFIHKNAFRYSTEKRYDLIWSAGLFDYFSDKLFVKLIQRMYMFLSERGELVVGNFSTNNSSRGVMEVVTQWYLHHRNEDELKSLAIKAGIPNDKIVINSEETGVNLFMHISK